MTCAWRRRSGTRHWDVQEGCKGCPVGYWRCASGVSVMEDAFGGCQDWTWNSGGREWEPGRLGQRGAGMNSGRAAGGRHTIDVLTDVHVAVSGPTSVAVHNWLAFLTHRMPAVFARCRPPCSRHIQRHARKEAGFRISGANAAHTCGR